MKIGLKMLVVLFVVLPPAVGLAQQRTRVRKPPEEKKPPGEVEGADDEDENEESGDLLGQCLGGCLGSLLESCLTVSVETEIDEDGERAKAVGRDRENAGRGAADPAVRPLVSMPIRIAGRDEEEEQTEEAGPAAATETVDDSQLTEEQRRELLRKRFEDDYYDRGGRTAFDAGGEEGRIERKKEPGNLFVGATIGGASFLNGKLAGDYNFGESDLLGIGVYVLTVPVDYLHTGLSFTWEKSLASDPQYDYEYSRTYRDSGGALRTQTVREIPHKLDFYSTYLFYDIGFFLEELFYLGGSVGVAFVEEKADITEELWEGGALVGSREAKAQMGAERFAWAIGVGLKGMDDPLQLQALMSFRFVENLPAAKEHPLALDYVGRLSTLLFSLGFGFSL